MTLENISRFPRSNASTFRGRLASRFRNRSASRCLNSRVRQFTSAKSANSPAMQDADNLLNQDFSVICFILVKKEAKINWATQKRYESRIHAPQTICRPLVSGQLTTDLKLRKWVLPSVEATGFNADDDQLDAKTVAGLSRSCWCLSGRWTGQLTEGHTGHLENIRGSFLGLN